MLPKSPHDAVHARGEFTRKELLRVLYVEDNDYVRDLTLCLLEHPTREVVAAKSAEEALDSFRRAPFDVLVTDLSLPHMSGLDLARRVREIAPHVWIVIASGYKLPTALDQLGPNVRAIAKPFESEDMDAIFREIREQSSEAVNSC